MSNYFNSLPLRTQLQELGKCRFMDSSEFEAGITPLAGKTLVIIGCGAQGFNQGLNLRDSGLNVSYALRKEAIEEQRPSWVKAGLERAQDVLQNGKALTALHQLQAWSKSLAMR